MHDIIFRHDLRPDDVDPLCALVRSTGFFSEEEVAVARELAEANLAQGPASGYLFVLAELPGAGGLAGYACFGPIPCTRGSQHLYWIAVRRDLHGQGLGRRIEAEAERAMRDAGARRVFLETSARPQYLPTRQFYLSLGFHEEARLRDYYDAGEDNVVFAKAL